MTCYNVKIYEQNTIYLIKQYLYDIKGLQSDQSINQSIYQSIYYYGKTKRHFKVRMCEQLGVSILTGKRVKGDKDSSTKEHNLFRNHSSGFDDFSMLANNNNDINVESYNQEKLPSFE